MTTQEIKAFALSLPETTEKPHFEKLSIRVKNKIFLTLTNGQPLITVKLTEADQSIFHEGNPESIFPVPNKWGKQGWTQLDATHLGKKLVREIILTAYCTVAPPRLVELVR